MSVSELFKSVAGRISGGQGDRMQPATEATTPETIGWYDLLPFASHRIRLAAERYTAETGVDPSVDFRTRLIVDRAEETGGLAHKSVLDLGCHEGGFALEFGRRGAAHVLGLEYRDVSVQRCDLARDLMGLENVRFERSDIMQGRLADGAQFDIVLATGILYHFDRPDHALGRIRSACKEFALIDTHVADREIVTHGCSEEDELVADDGTTYLGRWFAEFTPDLPDAEREKGIWASSTNNTSFWPYEDELARMLGDVGFRTVSKIENVDNEPWQVDLVSRVMYLCEV